MDGIFVDNEEVILSLGDNIYCVCCGVVVFRKDGGFMCGLCDASEQYQR